MLASGRGEKCDKGRECDVADETRIRMGSLEDRHMEGKGRKSRNSDRLVVFGKRVIRSALFGHDSDQGSFPRFWVVAS